MQVGTDSLAKHKDWIQTELSRPPGASCGFKSRGTRTKPRNTPPPSGEPKHKQCTKPRPLPPSADLSLK
ncbi:hypothetical protein EYF80_056379 [Liparis tanakae]|uniref:Uncharacterized protein n=1 Tax=Liparis tanakae TaxID=230148 RepID=A0A4Z2EZ09_9TELE|nr:hypothetical protein EYF80_056379 [Liparis tanakae]